MLTTTRQHGFGPDPVVIGRDLLLDEVAVGARLGRVLAFDDDPVEITGCQVVRCKYRIGESLRVVYRVEIQGRSHTVTVRTFAAGASGRAYRQALDGAVPAGSLRPVAHDAELDAVWWVFPNDRRLVGISDLLEPGPDVSWLADAGGAWRTSEVVEYAPERSLTLRAADLAGRPVAYVKAYAPGTVDVAALAARYDGIAGILASTGASVAAPTSLGWCRRRTLLVLEAMPGARWADLPPESLPAAFARLGEAIARVHEASAGLGVAASESGLGTARPFGRLQVRRVVHSAELVAAARPDVAERAGRLASALCAGPPPGDEIVLLHGDCHPKNALLDGDRLALIDFDQAGLGSPAADIGSLLARVLHDEVIGADAAYGLDTSSDLTHAGQADPEALAGAFLAAYQGVRALPSDASLRWHTAAAVVAERAMRAVNRLHPQTLLRLDEVLARAEHALTRGVPR